MFKFNFEIADTEAENPFCGDNKEIKCVSTKSVDLGNNCLKWYESNAVMLTKDVLEDLDVHKLNSKIESYGHVKISYVVSGCVLQDITAHEPKTSDIKEAELNSTDLIPGVYEGGAKIWECTIDLLNYLANNFTDDAWQGKRVLDLGCGSGLLGVYAFNCKAIVHFQDYNQEVLSKITISNVLLNAKADDDTTNIDLLALNESVKFYSGDWSAYAELTKNDEKFDYILTSETIYNPENQQKLLDTLFDKLKPSGQVLLAAKTHYFGVGGGLRQFEDLVENDKRLVAKVVWKATNNVGREILQLKHKS